MKKKLGLVSGVLGILYGITLIILMIAGFELPKILWLIFALCGFINAILILYNYNSKKTDTNTK